MAQIVDVTESSFEAEVIKSDLPVLLVFWAPWSAPSKQVVEILRAAAEEYSDRVKVVLLNIDDCPDLQARLKVPRIPTLAVYKNGYEEATKTGAMSKTQIYALINAAL
ncbi:thioredoxin family protein [Actinomadura oligospora]|uniref:thioredoxin family protein n=1 Tax=Actinomadura oligospora TaxID=111804 RepID=UPI00047D8567|nr:thioredoxin domain-containing protein [Actinomadura oligospora]